MREDDRVTSVLIFVASSTNPADGVLDHSEGLAASLRETRIEARVSCVKWRDRRLIDGVRAIRLELAAVRPDRVIVTYSQLSWSRRGLGFGLVEVVAMCRWFAPVTIWIHDPDRVGGTSRRHRIGNIAKALSLRWAIGVGGSAVVSVPPTHAYWMTPNLGRRVISVPSTGPVSRAGHRRPPDDLFTISSFGIGAGDNPAEAARFVAVATELVELLGPFRMRILGATSHSGPAPWLHTLERLGVVVDRPGALDADELAERLAESHVYISVRGGLTPRSSSTASAFASALPVVGFAGPETAGAVLSGGVIVLAGWDALEMARALVALAADVDRQTELSSLSLRAYDDHYAWRGVSARVAELLGAEHRPRSLS